MSDVKHYFYAAYENWRDLHLKKLFTDLQNNETKKRI